MKVGRGTHLYKLGYQHCICFPDGRKGRLQWAEATMKLTDLFGEPAHRRYFRVNSNGPVVSWVYRKHEDWILDRKWFSDTRHWENTTLGYWIAFRDERRFNLALLTIGDTP
jgi:hypothetical protein